ncbi:MAG: hypothetical protein NTX02_05395 [Planctomycetia bacterium]|nr:hypothetical protein [Planctomycetia bacterium]
MKRVMLWFILTAPMLCMVGCKSDLNQQLLERELRMQEDQIYQLQDQLAERCARLDRTNSENSSLKKQLGVVDPNASLPARISIPPGISAPAKPLRMAPPAAIAPPVLVPPSIEVNPLENAPPVTVPRMSPQSFSVPPPILLAPTEDTTPSPRTSDLLEVPLEPLPDSAAAPTVRVLSWEESLAEEGRISRIVLNQQKTLAYDANDDGFDDGITVVFEPRDQDERLVRAAGDVSVVLIDTTLSGDAARVARWEIPSKEALTHFRGSTRARGLHLLLKWPQARPVSSDLRLFVRLTSFDGRHFDAETAMPLHAHKQNDQELSERALLR